MPVSASFAEFPRDLRYSLRVLRNSPGFTAATILTLALGIGASTAMFSVVDAVLLRPLPFKDPARLVRTGETVNREAGSGFSAGTLLDWREHNRAFESLAGWASHGFNVIAQGVPERVNGMRVSWDFFKTLGVMPALGRSFTEGDDRPGAPRVAVLGYGLWQRVFAGDPGIPGRSVIVDGLPCTIIGVMPRRFRFFYGPEMWMPFALDRAGADRNTYYISGVARLQPGMSMAQAEAQFRAITRNTHRGEPNADKWDARVEPLGDAFVAQKELDRLLVLLGAVGFVLLIACVNAANLLLARATARNREMAVRSALGASRRRLVFQLLTESVLLAVGGGVLGLLLAFAGTRLAPALVSAAVLEARPEVAVNARVLAFAFALSILTGLFFGMFPAWRASRLDPLDSLKAGSKGAGGASAHAFSRGALVVAEVGLSLMLLVSAGLMIRSLVAMQHVDLGFRRDHLLTMHLAMEGERYRGAGPVRGFYRQVLEKAGAIPGVRSAAISMGQAPWDTPDATGFLIAGETKSTEHIAALERVSPEYFRTVGIALRKGRFFTDRDDEYGPPAAVVSQTFVTLYFSRVEPVGQRIVLGDKKWEIVGVAADVKFGGPAERSVPILYEPMLQSPVRDGSLALLTSADPMGVAQAVRTAIAEIDRDTPVTKMKTMDQIAIGSMSQPRTQTGLMTAFAAIALVLSGLGIYGVMSYTVAQSTHDIGIRMALGATAGRVLALVVGKGLLLTGAGLLFGIGGALALTRLLRSMLFSVKPTDPVTFAAVALLLALIATLAGLAPAHRATRIHPAIALRGE